MPYADELAGRSTIANWRVLGEKDCPEIGDIVAYSWPYEDASGHSGIYGGAGLVSAHTNGPVDAKVPNHGGQAKLVVRRYTGN